MQTVYLSRLPLMIGLSLAFSGTIAATPAAAAAWECSAKNLKGYSYSGGKSAMIHLKAYSSGGHYTVTKVSDTKVTGKTQDGTAFTCVKK